MAWDEPGLLLTTISIHKIMVKCDAMNIVCVCVERERGGGGGYNGISIEIKPKFIFFYFIRASANIVPWLPTRSINV